MSEMAGIEHEPWVQDMLPGMEHYPHEPDEGCCIYGPRDALVMQCRECMKILGELSAIDLGG